ncbi:MAG: hypothetical protein O2960_03460 [Verrucomicrobia bacterium]|nr:hypothetical protein [Verrucomicrobiota bacterium]
MKNQNGNDEIAATPIRKLRMRFFKIGKERPADLEGRSRPLTSDYNSIFVVLVLSIAAILAVILLVWA